MKLSTLNKLSWEQRTAHLDLSKPCCLESVGGQGFRQRRGKQSFLNHWKLEDDLENWQKAKCQLLHHCEHDSGNGWCSNPFHLSVGTPQENCLQKPPAVRKRAASKAGTVAHSAKDEQGRSLLGVRNGQKVAAQLNSVLDEWGRPGFAAAGTEAAHREKDALGRSVTGVKAAEGLHSAKNREGKSVNAVRGGHAAAEGTRAGHKQVWVCSETGFVGSPPCVAKFQKGQRLTGVLRLRLEGEDLLLLKEVEVFEYYTQTPTARNPNKKRRKEGKRLTARALERLKSGGRP